MPDFAPTCLQCGTRIDGGAPDGLCLRCLLSFGLKSEQQEDGDGLDSIPRQNPECTEQFDNYRVLEKLGEGGFGVVYRAVQLQPIRREVALKVIKLGMDTASVIARFEAERQALAMMDHPGIAKVFDAGSSRGGRPFFAMELVRGERITDYCDGQRLSIKQRLELFARVCEAVEHAHQKGVIHRDIKPSNILVLVRDGVAQPKVIDFGIAKATSRQRLAGQSIYTAFDQFIGTPTYMSPEQAGAIDYNVDTRSDIYSLGVLLYELLTGCPPFEPERLRRAAVDEVFRIIRDEDPARPSARLTKLSAPELFEISRQRVSAPPKLARELRGDLDSVVMKALEKLPARRYETASSLVAEIRRHLNHEPVQARPPSAAYRLGKTIRRNMLSTVAAAAVFGALIAGVFVSTWSYLREREARQQAVEAEARATTAANRSEHVSRLLRDVLAGAGPSVALGRDTTMLRELLDGAADRMRQDPIEDPDVEAELRETIGRAYYDLREFNKAEAMHRAGLTLRRLRFAETNDAVAEAMMDLAVVLNTRAGAKDLTEAESLFRPVLSFRQKEFGSVSLEAAKILQLLASNLRNQRKLVEAEKSYREALVIHAKLKNEESATVAVLLESLALVLTDDATRLSEAEDLIRRSALVRDRTMPRESPERIESLAKRGIVFRACGKPREAEVAVREAIALQKKLYGPESETLTTLLSTLAISLSEQGKNAAAEQAIREAVALQIKHRGPEHPHLANFLLNTLVKILLDQQKWAEAEAVGRDLIPLLKKVSPHRLLARLDALHLLGIAHLRQMNWAEAESVLREGLELCVRPLESGRSSSPARCARLRRMLGEALLRQAKSTEAESELLAACEILQSNQTRLDAVECEKAMAHLVELYDHTGRQVEAAVWKEKLENLQSAHASGTNAPTPRQH